MKANAYLVAVVCFAIATVAGVIVLVSEKGHWSQVAIPVVLLVGATVLWLQARKEAKT